MELTAIASAWQPWLFLLLLVFVYFQYFRRGLPLPPGPPSWPIIGNIPQLPTKHSWKQFHTWTKNYGPVFRLLAGRDTIIVLGNIEAAHELLDVRSANFSSRPYLPMAGELVHKGMHTLLRPWDTKCKLHKRLAAPLLTVAASRRVVPLQEMESVHLLSDLLKSNDFAPAIHRYAASVMFSLVYGFRIETLDEPVMLSAHQVQKNFVTAMKQGYWAVDAIPALQYLPGWMVPSKRLAEKWFQFESEHHLRNMKLARDSSSWNWTKYLLDSKAAEGIPRLEIAYHAGILVDAGLDTTGHALEVFVMAALNHPDKVALAQAELDRVVGQDRLPSFSDASKLVYNNAFIEELMRWRPIVIGGVPHSNLEESSYMGYRIPKGSVVLAPFWSIHMDESIYTDPEVFRPERWLEKREQPLPNVSFGFGRRACTGMAIARQSLFTVISRMLWAFEFKAAVDESGDEIQVDSMALTDYFVTKPEPFEVRFVPRHANVAKLVSESLQNCQTSLGALLDSIRPTNMSGKPGVEE